MARLATWVFLIFISTWVSAAERVGTFAVEMVRIRADWLLNENEGSTFGLEDSGVGFTWRHDRRLSAFAAAGSELTRNLPAYYSAPNEDRLGFYEAYAEYDGVYGRVRLGLLPLQFGYDGVLGEEERYFKRTLPFAERAIALRDLGASFFTENKGYYTQLTVHNGEIDTESDGRLWISGNWGFANNRDFRAQLSLQTGDVTGSLSQGATTDLGGVTNGETAHWRNGLFFLNWYPQRWNVVTQIGGGEVEQGAYKGRFSTNMFEASYALSKNFSTGLRYDSLDPNRKVDGDMKTEASLVFLFKSDDSTSNVYLLGTKVLEESNEKPNDEVRLVWLLTPYSH